MRRLPAEWESHRACWLAYPFRINEWPNVLERAQAEFLDLCRAIEGEQVHVLVPDEGVARTVREQTGATTHIALYGDCWTRDTGPLFIEEHGRWVAAGFRFNGWGEKYLIPGDPDVARTVAGLSGVGFESWTSVLEGGAVDVDGQGTVLTTRQCLLHTNRNGWTETDAEAFLGRAIGATRTVWLDDGLLHDHTDGHVDTLARFVGPGRVVCMRPQGKSDPNEAALLAIEHTLREYRDAHDQPLDVLPIPSPGRVESDDGELLPASYCNFYIANESVVVPTYGVAADAEAVAAIAACFPDRVTVGRSARAILTGGGAFHCMTQQQPMMSDVPLQ